MQVIGNDPVGKGTGSSNTSLWAVRSLRETPFQPIEAVNHRAADSLGIGTIRVLILHISS
jgi:hypothetical protein